MIRRTCVVLLMAVTIACARQATPAPLDTTNTACHTCRMAVSDVRFAAQIAVPGVEPQFFDDLGCLRDYFKQPGKTLPARAMVFVADHRTGEWVPAASAVFSRASGVSTPMNGGIIAHASEASRQQDAAAAGGTAVSASEIFGPAGPPKGGRQ